ncbi:MAG: DNA mismatch repair protein MutS [Bacteroidota bacterium]
MSTPLMRQYQQVKAKHRDTILLFRMGDFYETFDEDAKIASKVLGITLTKRGNGAAGEVPLAGFPYHALESFLPKLLKAGHRVAICEQLEDPKFAKGIVKRDVIEVVTPGVAFSDKVLERRHNNFLACVALTSAIANADDKTGLAFVDVSTGEFGVLELPLRHLKDHLENLQPAELLVQKRDRITIETLLKGSLRTVFTTVDDWVLNEGYGYDLLIQHFKTKSLKGFGLEESKQGIVAAGAIMNYLQETQKANLPHIRKITLHEAGDSMILDTSTKRNLEITSTIQGQSDGTLFSVLDRTQTPMGGRLLQQWVHRPLKKIESIQTRLSAVKELFEHREPRKELAAALGSIGDLERLIGRIATGRATPRDVRQLSDYLGRIPALAIILNLFKSGTLSGLRDQLRPLPDLVGTIGKALSDDAPLSMSDGGVIRKGYNAELDELRGLSFSGKDWIARLQEQERRRTGISSLKVGYNNVFGYYIEITNTHKDKVPTEYIRKQTLTNAERYITPDLKEYEEKILHAEERILALETRLFDELRQEVSSFAEEIQANAAIIAALDCYTALAGVAAEYQYCCPVVDDSTTIEIRQGRHPVIERLLPPGERYTPNDTMLDTVSQQILIITGPNMSGKSSYLRQVGLITLLAQMGSFVPATSARIGIVDKIYTRVGASDNITSGESTFLVEMHEAANILNTATGRSLVLLDEIGRGTSTFDGISIAWALTEYLHQRVGARTLFATHYHELNELAELFPKVKNYKVDVREYEDKVIFLHKVVPGFADHSYGIQVAELAGLPIEVTERAKVILKNLEQTDLSMQGNREGGLGNASEKLQMTLFEVQDDELRNEIRKLDLNSITPLDALRKLTEIKERFKEKKT